MLLLVPLILICPNGHISDIQWYKFFCASLKHEKMDDDAGLSVEYRHYVIGVEGRLGLCKLQKELQGKNITGFVTAEWNT